MSENESERRLTNLYIPKYSEAIKFSIITLLTQPDAKNQRQDEEYKVQLSLPAGICDAATNNQAYKSLISFT